MRRSTEAFGNSIRILKRQSPTGLSWESTRSWIRAEHEKLSKERAKEDLRGHVGRPDGSPWTVHSTASKTGNRAAVWRTAELTSAPCEPENLDKASSLLGSYLTLVPLFSRNNPESTFEWLSLESQKKWLPLGKSVLVAPTSLPLLTAYHYQSEKVTPTPSRDIVGLIFTDVFKNHWKFIGPGLLRPRIRNSHWGTQDLFKPTFGPK